MQLHTFLRLRWIALWLLFPILSGAKGESGPLSMRKGQQPQATKKLTAKQAKALKDYLVAPLAEEGISEIAQTYIDELGGVQDLEKAYRAYLKRFGSATVAFKKKDDGMLHVKITTQRLVLTSMHAQGDIELYLKKLYGDPAVMQKYADCKIRDYHQVKEEVEEWAALWQRGCPFASLTVRTKNGAFVGRVILEAADEEDGPNSAEKATMIAKAEWNKGYGTEITGAILFFYAPELYKNNFLLPNGNVFKRIVNTVRPDNVPSLLTNIRVGLIPVRESLKYGDRRLHLYIDMKKLMQAIGRVDQAHA